MTPSRWQQWIASHPLGRNLADSRYALGEALLIGIIAALAALLLKQGTAWVGMGRLQLAHRWGDLWTLPAIGASGAWLAGWLIENYAPTIRSGGIPPVKAVLGQAVVPMSFKMAAIKVLSTITLLGSGITLGRAGPSAHIGATLAAQLSQWLPTSPEHRRQMIAAGAAAGLAAGLNTPIAGVLFVMEELMRDLSNLTLGTAILASFTGAVISQTLGLAELRLPPEMLGKTQLGDFSLPELPFYLLLGGAAGVLGSIFSQMILKINRFAQQSPLKLSTRLGLLGLFSGGLIALLPPFFHNNAGLRDFLILGNNSIQNTALVFVVHFFLSALAYGNGAPGGIFAPVLVLGAALGSLVGYLAQWALDGPSHSSYALVGMGAFFTAVVKAPVTAIVIVFELGLEPTADFNLVLPLMLASVTAFGVANQWQRRSLYESLLAASGIVVQERENTPALLVQTTAEQVMQRHVETISPHWSLSAVRSHLSHSPHRGFPVVHEGRLVGILTQSDLPDPRSPQGEEPLVWDLMTPNPLTVQPQTSLAEVLYLLNRYHLSRLPVAVGRDLLGIITRTDIIRVEAQRLGGQGNPEKETSWVIYRTRSPLMGQGKLLLPLGDEDTAQALFDWAGLVAKAYDYDITCLHIIPIQRHQSPSRTKVNSHRGRKLLQHAERWGRKQGLRVHTQIRIAHSVSQAILETLTSDPEVMGSEMVVVGGRLRSDSEGMVWGRTIQDLIARVPCDLLILKLGLTAPHEPPRWLLPLAGGPNARRALDWVPYWLPAHAQLFLCQIHNPHHEEMDARPLEEAFGQLRDRFAGELIPLCLRSPFVAETLIQLVQDRAIDGVILGASGQSLLQQTFYGNLPNQVLKSVPCTVAILRAAPAGDRSTIEKT